MNAMNICAIISTDKKPHAWIGVRAKVLVDWMQSRLISIGFYLWLVNFFWLTFGVRLSIRIFQSLIICISAYTFGVPKTEPNVIDTIESCIQLQTECLGESYAFILKPVAAWYHGLRMHPSSSTSCYTWQLAKNILFTYEWSAFSNFRYIRTRNIFFVHVLFINQVLSLFDAKVKQTAIQNTCIIRISDWLCVKCMLSKLFGAHSISHTPYTQMCSFSRFCNSNDTELSFEITHFINSRCTKPIPWKQLNAAEENTVIAVAGCFAERACVRVYIVSILIFEHALFKRRLFLMGAILIDSHFSHCISNFHFFSLSSSMSRSAHTHFAQRQQTHITCYGIHTTNQIY